MLKLREIILECMIVLSVLHKFECNNDYCEKDFCDYDPANIRYLFYDVNLLEGFNLRRDVYMRFAILVHKLKYIENEKLNNFKLVLPPWFNLVHWEHRNDPQHLPWSLFFDLPSLQKFAPVIEMTDFFNLIDANYVISIDQVYILQHFEDMFETGNFEERMKIEECTKSKEPSFFFYSNMTSSYINCLSFHGPATKLTDLLRKSDARTILIDHAEVALHEMFGSNLYWRARRSMRFSKDLQKVATTFREKYLNSTDESDYTVLPDDWTKEKPKRNARGGPYIAVHLRRRDFVRGRPKDTPSLEYVAIQIVKALKSQNLDTVFIATDAPNNEYNKLLENIPNIYKVVRYVPSRMIKEKYQDGGIAIIDQIICSHARFFIGTHESTFSFRIQEEREIFGFPVESTFNSLCKNEKNCHKPSIWKIVY